ncbi:Sensor histidine kinase YpdA [compost metagenome]
MNQFTDDVYKYAANMVNDELLQRFAQRTEYASVYEEMEAYREVVLQLTKFNVLRDYLESSAIIRSDGKVFWSSLYLDPYFDRLLQEEWYQSELAGDAKSGFTAPHEIWDQGPKKVVSFFIRFDPKYGGVLLLNLDYAVFTEMFNYLEKSFDQYAWVNAQDAVWVNEGIPEERVVQLSHSSLNGIAIDKLDNGYYLTTTFEKTGWSMITFTSKERFFELLGYVIKYWVIFVLLCLVLCYLLFLPIISSITRPISQMSKAMKQVSMGNYDVKLTINSNDELSILKHGFEKMLGDIKVQINEKVEQERWKRRMSAELLFAQINPHFIYNTLNTVVYMARKAKHKPIEEMMESFIGILHDAVKIGDAGLYVTVEQEVEIIDHYIRIQRYRYADSFHLDWNVAEEARYCPLPRSLLQPLIENAIVHGFSEKEGIGHIEVTIWTEGERLSVLVKDDGIGMPPDMIDALENGQAPVEVRRPEGMKQIGLRNIRERIGYLYGEAGRMSISLPEEGGTTILLSLPIQPDILEAAR